MASDGYTVDTGLLTTLAKNLDQLAQDTASTLGTYDVSQTPDFGQSSSFTPAHQFAGQYASRAKEHADSRTEFLTWLQTMANVAGILGKRYATVEELGRAGANDIKSALDQATAMPSGGIQTTF
jgi:hypothetical protein